MDDEARQLLREMRDILRESSEREAAWHKQLLANTKRARRIAFFIVFPVMFTFLSICAWGIVSSSQAERERAQEDRRYRDELQRYRDDLQRKMEERRNQFMRPKDLGHYVEQPPQMHAQKIGTVRPCMKC